MTVRERMLGALARAGAAGLSRSELQRAADCNPGRFRTVLAQVVSSGEVVVATEDRNHGPTSVHRLKGSSEDAA